MSLKEQVVQELDNLNETELRHVAEYLAFLRFRSRFKPMLILDETQIADRYAEFADEDRELAEEGMEVYVRELAKEDA